MIQVDRNTIIQILGGLMQKPELLSDIDKYLLEPSDFSNPLDKFIFTAIYNLYTNGAELIHGADIDNYLKDNAFATELIEKENGLIFLQDCETNADYRNFEYYYNKLKKINLVRELKMSQYKIDNIYCEDILNEDYNKINEKFEQLTVQEIINSLKISVSNIENKYCLNNILEESKPSDTIRERVKEWKQKPEVGCMLQGDIFNTITRGGRKGKLYIRSAGSGVGKALPNYTKIPTPNGWKTVGEIKVGDYLFDRFGKSTKVLAIYPQKEKKQVYKVYFKSGRIAECCEEHLWSYYSNLNDKHPDTLITSTLREIIDNPKGLKNNKGAYRWSIPINKPVQYTEKKYSIDPYVMGLILGDGSFRYGNNKSFSFSSSDEELVKAICVKQNYKCYKKNSDYNYNWTFELLDGETHKKVWVEDILKDYPELWNIKSEEKFIPEDFMFGSIEQRYDLLSGLLDTDGSIDDKGRISFSTISPMLKDNIISLCESLGMICNYSTDIRKEKYTTGECYSVHIQASKEDKIKLFKLKRKLDKAIQYVNNGKRAERRDRDAIIDIKATDIYTDMTCFYVDNDEHLFLMNDYICTHNTRSMVGDACNIAYPIRYDPKIGKWVSTGSCEKVLYVMTEQDTEEIDTMIMAYLTGYNEDVFTYGTFDENDIRIKTAIDIMERFSDNMNYAKIPDPCSSVVKNLFRRRNLQDGIENFFYDYIFSSPAMLNEYRDLKIREDVALRLFTTTLKNLSVELNAFILTSTQVSNDDDPKGGFKDFRNVQGSKSIVNLADFACIMSRPTVEELNQISGFQKSFGYTPNLVTDIYKNRRGRWNMVRIWSYHDLGTCRKADLFITNSSMKPIDDFVVVNFKAEIDKDILKIQEEYNQGFSEMIENFETNISEDTENLFDNFSSAFGDKHDRINQIKDKSFEDLL